MKEIDNKLSIIEKAIEDKKGIDLQVLDISKMTSIADYFVIVSGNSSSQVTSIADEVEDKMSLAGFEPLSSKEGYNSARWILIDYEDVIVHVFHKDEREFYNLERLWSQYERENTK
ncbi:ribosome silencing factor [Tissierella creatinini]|nr:ribosome silencing factor [Tissierella creatinini]TJX63631.1 ribosome silencing factor [Soehngenia saccharolytica]